MFLCNNPNLSDAPACRIFQGREQRTSLSKGIRRIFDATHVPELQEQAQRFVRDLSQAVFSKEWEDCIL